MNQLKWYDRGWLRIAVELPQGMQLPTAPVTLPVCLFPENLTALSHLNDKQFRWALALFTLCQTPRAASDPTPLGCLPAWAIEDFWKIAGASSPAEWLAECRPILDLFSHAAGGTVGAYAIYFPRTYIVAEPSAKLEPAAGSETNKAAEGADPKPAEESAEEAAEAESPLDSKSSKGRVRVN